MTSFAPGNDPTALPLFSEQEEADIAAAGRKPLFPENERAREYLSRRGDTGATFVPQPVAGAVAVPTVQSVQADTARMMASEEASQYASPFAQAQPPQEAAKAEPRRAGRAFPSMGGVRSRYRRGMRQGQEAEDRALGELGSALDQQAEVERQQSEQAYLAGQEYAAEQEGMREEHERRAAARQAGEQKAQAAMQEAALEAQYPGAALPDIRDAQEVMRSETASDTERAQAKRFLDRSAEVDKDRYLNKSLGTKFTAAIAVALGGLARMYDPRAPNTALQIVQSNIERDIQAQKQRFASKRDAAGRARGHYAMMRQKGLDEVAAEEAARAQLYQGFIRKLDQTNIENQGSRAKADIDKLRAEAEMNAARHQQSAAQKMASTEAALIGAETRQLAAMAPAQTMRLPGLEVTGEKQITKEDEKAITKTRAEVVTILGMIDDLEQHVDTHGREWNLGYQTDASKLGETKSKAIALKLKGPAFEQLGVLAGPDMEILASQVPEDPGSMRQEAVKESIRALRTRLVNEWTNKARQRGVRDLEIGLEE